MSSPPPGFERRHVVSVEDHLYHTTELLEAMAHAAPELLAWTTVCAIDEPGPDTSAAITGWLERYGSVQVVARVDARDVTSGRARRLFAVDASSLAELSSFAKLVASLLQPGGVLVQDVHLSTLPFIPPDRWWDSIYVAATVRGMFAREQPAVRFVSNKRGYAATFGRDLMAAGFDPREVMDKAELETVIVPSIARDVAARFPADLVTPDQPLARPVTLSDDSRREIEGSFDLVEWDVSGRVELGGRLVAAPVIFRNGSNEAITWQRLITERLAGGTGVPVVEVGQRLAEPGADRAEISNLAARHVHALRARLSDPAAIVTANHAYHLSPSVAIGRVRRRAAAHLRQPSGSRGPEPDRPE